MNVCPAHEFNTEGHMTTDDDSKEIDRRMAALGFSRWMTGGGLHGLRPESRRRKFQQ